MKRVRGLQLGRPMRNLLPILLVVALACSPAKPARQSGDLVAAGWEYYRLGEFDQAVRTFQQAATDAATRVPALFGEAQTWHLRRPDPDLEKAAALYRQVAELAPQSEYAAWSSLALAWIKIATTTSKTLDIPTATQAFEAVLARFPNQPAGQEGFLSLQAVKLHQTGPAIWREVLVALDQFLQQHPQTTYASAAHLLRAHCYRMLAEPVNELAAVRQAWQVEEVDPENPKRNPVGTYWRIATLAEFDVGDFTIAREYYRRLIAEYPTEQRVFLAKQELRHMDEIEAQIRRELTGQKGGGQ